MKYDIVIQGVTPYMQHRMDDLSLADWERNRGLIMERPGLNVEDTKLAEYRCYRNSNGKCFMPAEHVRGALIDAGAYHKAKMGGKSKSMTQVVAAMFIISPEHIYLPDYDIIDKRSAVNRNVKGRIIVIRPMWTKWEAAFTLDTGEDHFTESQLTGLLETAGKYIGLGSFRPTHRGMYGRFEIKSFKVLKETAKPPRK